MIKNQKKAIKAITKLAKKKTKQLTRVLEGTTNDSEVSLCFTKDFRGNKLTQEDIERFHNKDEAPECWVNQITLSIDINRDEEVEVKYSIFDEDSEMSTEFTELV